MALDYLLGKYQKGSAYATLFFSAVASLFVPSNAIAQEAYQEFRNPRAGIHYVVESSYEYLQRNRRLQVTLKVTPPEAQHKEDKSQLAKVTGTTNNNGKKVEVYLDDKLIFLAEGQIRNYSTSFPINYVGPKEVVAKAYKGNKVVTSKPPITVTGLNTPPGIYNVVFDEGQRTISFNVIDDNVDPLEKITANYSDGTNTYPLDVSNDLFLTAFKTSAIPQSSQNLKVTITASDHHKATTTTQKDITAPILENIVLTTVITTLYPDPIAPLNGALFELYEGSSTVEGSNVIGKLVDSVRVSHDGVGSLTINPGIYIGKWSHTDDITPYIEKFEIKNNATLDVGLDDGTLNKDFYEQVARIGLKKGTIRFDKQPHTFYINTGPALICVEPSSDPNTLCHGEPLGRIPTPEENDVVENAIRTMYNLLVSRSIWTDTSRIEKGINPPSYGAEYVMRFQADDREINGIRYGRGGISVRPGTNIGYFSLVSFPTGLNLEDLRRIILHEKMHGLGMEGHPDPNLEVTTILSQPGFKNFVFLTELSEQDEKALLNHETRRWDNTSPDNNLESILLTP